MKVDRHLASTAFYLASPSGVAAPSGEPEFLKISWHTLCHTHGTPRRVFKSNLLAHKKSDFCS